MFQVQPKYCITHSNCMVNPKHNTPHHSYGN